MASLSRTSKMGYQIQNYIYIYIRELSFFIGRGCRLFVIAGRQFFWSPPLDACNFLPRVKGGGQKKIDDPRSQTDGPPYL